LFWLSGAGQIAYAGGHQACLQGWKAIEFGYRNLSMRLLAAGVLMAGLFAIFGKVQLLGACLYVFPTSLGYMRRSWQAKRASVTPDA
jgi:hypothetical protein